MGFGAALGSVFSGVLNFGLGMSNQQNQNVLNAQQLAFAREQMERNEALQREFAQHGLRWKVADAKAAGVHPLFAMGAPGQSFSPMAVGYNPQSSGGLSVPDFGALGQNIERAINAGKTQNERNNYIDANAVAMQQLQLENAQLQNDYLRANILRISNNLGPPMPSGVSAGGGLTGQQPGVVKDPSTGEHEMKPFEVSTAQPGSPGQAAGRAQPSVSWGLTADGSGFQAYPAKIPGLDEVEGPLGWEWYLRNRIMPIISPGDGPDMAVVRQRFPTAIGVRFDHDSLTWKPVFSNRPAFASPPKSTARDVGVGIRHPMLTSVWRNYR